MATKKHIPKFSVQLRSGKFELSDPRSKTGMDQFKAYFATLPDGWYYLILHPETKDRSLKENAYYWGVVIAILFESTGWFLTGDDWHEFLKQKFNSKFFRCELKYQDSGKPILDEAGHPMIAEVTVPQSTASLSTVEFEDYLSKIRTWASLEHQIYIPLPNEVVTDEGI